MHPPVIDFTAWQPLKPVIGMLHLAPLPGSPLARGGLAQVIDRALADAEALVSGGCHGLMMENFGDVPFTASRVSAAVVASMARVAGEVRRHFPVPLGINVLRNDGLSALGIAAASGADFIRVNVLTGARVTDQGVIQGIADQLLRERQALGAGGVCIFADVDVKHSAPLAPRPLVDEVKDTLMRGLADGVIVSGSGTGAQVDVEKLATVKAAAGEARVWVGSGATGATLPSLAAHADGFIVGTAFKIDGVSTNAVDPARVRAFMAVHAQLPPRVR